MRRLLRCRVSLLQSKFDPLALWPGTGRIGVATVQPKDACRYISITRRRDLELKNLTRLRAEGRHIADDCRRAMLGVEHVVPIGQTPSQRSTKTTSCNDRALALNVVARGISYTLFLMSTGSLVSSGAQRGSKQLEYWTSDEPNIMSDIVYALSPSQPCKRQTPMLEICSATKV